MMQPDPDQIVDALGPRPAIREALDILMARHDLSEAEAIAMLVPGATDRDIRTRLVVARMLDRSASWPA